MQKTKHIKTIFFLVLTSISFNVVSQNIVEESIKRGKKIYMQNCVACHMPDGKGMTGAFSPLAKSDYLMEDINRSITTILEGLNGEITVNGITYYGAMVPFNSLTDKEIADVSNYIRNNWGNQGKPIEPELVADLRK
ncbi:c-type cytochrome [Algibacter mikhailovii]|uniref:Cytochrome c domain-containing protein n=1 Tax=Algibacter mikhailovii TaxID=425498 RepID=A0A918V9U2_9FLAO|nr:cytochrome c [Algibacter mikhailovii]GGZ83467.1 hypothetical protein GCM10007028_21830 [Algibacter mikhailovii]